MFGNLTCPITAEAFREPVVAADGFTYERSALLEWLKTNSTSPMTREALVADQLVPNRTLQSALVDAFVVHWTDDGNNVSGSEAFCSQTATVRKLKARLKALEVEHDGTLLADDASLPFGQHVHVYRGMPRLTTSLRPSDMLLQVQVQLGFQPVFWLNVPWRRPTASKIKRLIAQEQERRHVVVTCSAVVPTRLTAWRASILGQTVPLELKPGCHDMKQDLGQVVCPFDSAQILWRVAKQLALPVARLSLVSFVNKVQVDVPCEQPPTTEIELHDLNSAVLPHRRNQVTVKKILVNPLWTVEHLKKHLQSNRRGSIQLFAKGQSLADDDLVPLTGPLHFMDHTWHRAVHVLPGCHEVPARLLFYIGLYSVHEDDMWQASQLLGIPVARLRLKRDGDLFNLEIACLSDPRFWIVVVTDEMASLMSDETASLVSKCKEVAKKTMHETSVSVAPDRTVWHETDRIVWHETRLNVAADWTVFHVKRHMKRCYASSAEPDEMRLVYCDDELPDEQTLTDCGIRPGALLRLSPRTIPVTILWTHSGVKQELYVRKKMYVAELQRMLWQELRRLAIAPGLTAAQWSVDNRFGSDQSRGQDMPLFHNGMMLGADLTLDAHCILPNSEIKANPRAVVHVLCPNDHICSFVVVLTETVNDLISKATNLLNRNEPNRGKKSSAFMLQFQDRILDIDSLLFDCGVRKGSELQLKLRSHD